MAETQISELFPNATVVDGVLSIPFTDLPGLTESTTHAEKVFASLIVAGKDFFTEQKRVTDATKSITFDPEVRLSAEPFYDPITNLIAGNYQVMEFTIKFYKEMQNTEFNPMEY